MRSESSMAKRSRKALLTRHLARSVAGVAVVAVALSVLADEALPVTFRTRDVVVWVVGILAKVASSVVEPVTNGAVLVAVSVCHPSAFVLQLLGVESAQRELTAARALPGYDFHETPSIDRIAAARLSWAVSPGSTTYTVAPV